MIDTSKLKELALAATQGEWTRDQYGNLLAEDGDPPRFRGLMISCAGSGVPQAEANTDWLAAANPAAILEVLAENEKQAARIAELEGVESAPERFAAAYTAKLERLCKSEARVAELLAELETLEKLRKLCDGGKFDLTDSPKSFVSAATELLRSASTEPAAPQTAASASPVPRGGGNTSNESSDLAHVARQRQESSEPSLKNWLNIIHDNELSLGDRLERVSNSIRSLLAGDAPDKYAAHVIREQRFDAEAFAAASGKDVMAKDVKRDDFNCSTVLDYIQFLAWAIWRDHYRAASPNFCILADALGALSQIDNMVTGLKSTPSAAEGVDTADFRRLSYEYADALMHKSVPATNDAWRALVAHIETVYGAQQREAGRQSQIARIRHLEHERDEARAALARQQAEIDRLMLEFCPNEMTPEQVAEWGRNQRRAAEPVAAPESYPVGGFAAMTAAPDGDYYRVEDVQALSAAPPAKAEGMTPEVRTAIHDAMGAVMLKNNDLAYELLCAILAQQAEGATK